MFLGFLTLIFILLLGVSEVAATTSNFFGLAHTTATNVSILSNTEFIFAILIAIMIFHERLHKKEYFPHIKDSMKLAFDTMVSTSDGYTKYNDDNGEEHYIIYKKLSHFDWILAYEKPKNLLLMGNTTLGELRSTILITSIVIMASGLAGIIIFSSTISRPITRLKRAAENVLEGMLDIKIKLEGSTEMQNLISAFTKITESLRKTTLERDMIKQELNKDKTENSKNDLYFEKR